MVSTNNSAEKFKINLFFLRDGSMAGYIGDKFVFSRNNQSAIKKAPGRRGTSSRSRSRRSPVRSASKSGDDGGGEDSDGSDPEPPKLKLHPLAALSKRRWAA